MTVHDADGRKRASRAAMACGLCVLVAVCLLWPLPNAYRAGWLATLLDLLHVPLFAGLTIALLLVLKCRLAVAWGLAVALAAAGEFGQLFVGRSGSVADCGRGMLGASLAAVVLWAGLPRRLPAGGQMPGGSFAAMWPTGIAAVAVAAVLAWGWSQYGPEFSNAWRAYRSFPVLADFSSPREELCWRMQSASLRRIDPGDSTRRPVGEVEFLPNAQGASGLILFPVVRDWSEYRRLHCELAFRGPSIALGMSVRDGRKVAPPQRRFDFRTRLVAGRHDICLDLAKLADGDDHAPVDLRRVQSFHLWLEGFRQPRQLVLYRIYLD